MRVFVSASVPPPGYVPPPGTGDSAPAPRPVRARSRRPLPRKPIAAGAALFAAVAAVFALFGSSSNQSVDPVAQAASLSASAPGWRMNMQFTVSSPQFGAPIEGSATAVVDPPDHAISMSLAMDLSQIPQAAQMLGGTMRIGMVLDGDEMYMKFPPAMARLLPTLGGKPWLEANLSKLTGVPGLSSFGGDPTTSDPAQMLQYLRAASDGITDEGTQVLDGVRTMHYRVLLNLDHVPTADQAALSQLERVAGGQDVPFDVWIDAHHLVRRIVMSLTLKTPNGPSLQETLDAHLYDYGPQPRPTPPPADQVSQLTSLLGG